MDLGGSDEIWIAGSKATGSPLRLYRASLRPGGKTLEARRSQ